MQRHHSAEPEIFTVHEVARAAGVPAADVQALLAAGEAAGRRYLSFEEAVRLVRSVRGVGSSGRRDRFFTVAPNSRPRRGTPLLISGALHAAFVAAALVVAGLGGGAAATEDPVRDAPRLVFLTTPGPGGGGGGGGLRQRVPPPPAQLRGRSPLRSPVTVARSTEVRQPDPPVLAASRPAPVPEPAPEPQPPAPEVTPPIVAPVASAAGDDEDEPGILADSQTTAPSQGPGEGDGIGSGRDSGTGGGEGAGIGDGSIAGTGGGPYRPGSGTTPPSLVREIKPIYTEEARRRGVEGDVLLEVVVRADGAVGAVRIVRALGAGLDQRAVDAVRQWVFSPARRFGAPVDVLVEVAVEFRLR